ncbi:hypothetical protein BURPS1655_E0678 [Burkholderia pseudomallei 1655]|nr:hypothetical protein BURPS1655_E0678 [Burkholderia pseudomallei 1655]
MRRVDRPRPRGRAGLRDRSGGSATECPGPASMRSATAAPWP